MSSRLLSAAMALAMIASPAAASQRHPKMRFQGLDRNHDGRITREEWNGSDRSFGVHDWNGDGILSGEEVRPGARRPEPDYGERDFDASDQEYEFDDWTVRGFNSLDHNRDERITAEEWHFDREGFRRADHDRDGVISRREFLNEDAQERDDDREDRFVNLDVNRDNRISRGEWHGARANFDLLDDNRDGVLTRMEVFGMEPPPDLFTSVDVDRNGAIERQEWHWSAESFDRLDSSRDGQLTREEFSTRVPATASSLAYRAGHDRGLLDGRDAGREDRTRNQGWDLEGQRELEQADAGYEPRMGVRADYQAGYRDAFRAGYREGFGTR